MTKQEALQELMDLSIDYGTRTAEEIERLDEAVDMAIKALKVDALERQPCDDAVSRQQAIDALKGLPTWWADEGGYYGGAQPPMVALLDPEDAVSAIENLPAAQSDYQEVLGWLLAYHTMSFDLHGRYLPHEVISWLINDFTKEFIVGRGQNG